MRHYLQTRGRFSTWLALVFILMLVVSACAPTSPTSTVVALVENIPTATAELPAPNESSSAESPSSDPAAVEPTPGNQIALPMTSGSGYPAPAEASAPQPTVRPGMEATDPGAFALASGQVQFVEFFAFW